MNKGTQNFIILQATIYSIICHVNFMSLGFDILVYLCNHFTSRQNESIIIFGILVMSHSPE